MRAPAAFLVRRHLITHPDDGPSDVARHARLHVPTVSKAIGRIRDDRGLWTEQQLLGHLQRLAERPKWRTHALRLPNPARWVEDHEGRHLISGETAAALEGFDLIPERHLVYVAPDDIDDAVRSAVEEGGRLAPRERSNLMLKTMDPWLYEEPSGFVERGQRLLDYAESKHIQLLIGLRRLD